MTHIIATYQILFSYTQVGEAKIRTRKDKWLKVETRLRLRLRLRAIPALAEGVAVL